MLVRFQFEASKFRLNGVGNRGRAAQNMNSLCSLLWSRWGGGGRGKGGGVETPFTSGKCLRQTQYSKKTKLCLELCISKDSLTRIMPPELNHEECAYSSVGYSQYRPRLVHVLIV